MKIIKIGRDATSNILLEHEMISRHHAILRIYSTGKIELISMGANGTKLNGTLVRPNMVYKVKRSDMISFAGKYQLDWALVPDPLKKVRIALICLAACLLLGCLAVAGSKVYNYFNPQMEPESESLMSGTAVVEEPKSKANDGKALDVAPLNPTNGDGLAVSLDKAKAQQDSIKRQKEQAEKETESSVDRLFQNKEDKKKVEKPKEKKPAKPTEEAPAKPTEEAPAKPAEEVPAKPAEEADDSNNFNNIIM